MKKENDCMINLKEVLKIERYKYFTILEEPIPFNELFKDQNFDVVQLHSVKPCGENDIVGFCGAFEWHDNTLTPCDGDSYYSDTLVYGFKEFENVEGWVTYAGLDILVLEW